MTSLGVPGAARRSQVAPGHTRRDGLATDQLLLRSDEPEVAGIRATGRLSRFGLKHLRWITVAIPVAVLAVLMHLMAFALPEVFQTPLGYSATVALLLLAVVTFSHFVFAAIERLERRITRQNARLRVAASVAAVLSEPGEPSAVSQRVLEAICEPLGADAGLIRLTDARTGAQAATTRGLSPDEERLLGAKPIELDGASLVDDTVSHPKLRGIADASAFRCLLLVPLVAHGSTEGSLIVASRQPRRFSEGDRQLLEQVARQIGVWAQRSSLLAELVDRNKELRILNDHSAALSAAHQSAEVLDVVLRTLVEVSASDSGEFWLQDDGSLQLVQRIEAGTPGDEPVSVAPVASVSLSDPQPGQRLLRVQRSGTSSFEVNDAATQVCLPVRAGGRVSGVVHLVGKRQHRWSDRRRRLLETIADQGGVAVSDARQRARAREMAVLEERGRIAREMHDGLAQVLGYLNTKTFAIRRTLDDGDPVSAASMLADLEEAARDASADVREGVLALHSTDSTERDLLRSISAYVEKFQRMSGIRIKCHVSADCEALRLPEMAQLQIIRLIQEALSNVRKHSGASHATLSISTQGDALAICIDDAGAGFDTDSPSTSGRPSFGLQTMRERAEAVGGRLSVTSAPGQGTQVNALVPIRPPAAVAA